MEKEKHSKTLCVIGLGLIGGSMALDLKKSGFAAKIIGVENSAEYAKQALDLGIADEILPLKKAVQNADLVVVATPVNTIAKLLPRILDLVPKETAVTDVGSTKTAVIQSVASHAKRKRYVPSHPMAGTENSGPAAAFQGLFQNKTAIICNAEDSDKQAVHTVEKMYESIGAELVFMDAASHDEHVGYVSHLSHVISYALAVAVLEKEKDDSAIFNLASGGFSSTVRLAKSSEEMWLPIFLQNKKFILPILEIYLEKLNEFKKYLRLNEIDKLSGFIKEANKIRKKLEK